MVVRRCGSWKADRPLRSDGTGAPLRFVRLVLLAADAQNRASAPDAHDAAHAANARNAQQALDVGQACKLLAGRAAPPRARGFVHVGRPPSAARLASLPLRLALLQEGADALLGVGEGGVEGHDLLGVGVGLLGGHLELAVEGLLADSDDERAGFDYLLRERAGLSLKLAGRDHLVDEPFGPGFFGGDELAGE